MQMDLEQDIDGLADGEKEYRQNDGRDDGYQRFGLDRRKERCRGAEICDEYVLYVVHDLVCIEVRHLWKFCRSWLP